MINLLAQLTDQPKINIGMFLYDVFKLGVVTVPGCFLTAYLYDTIYLKKEDRENNKAIATDVTNTITKLEGEKMELTLEAFTTVVNAVADQLNAKIDGVSEQLTAKIDGVSEQLTAKIDGVSEQLTAKIDGVSEQLTAKIDGVSEQLTDTNSKLDKLTDQVRSIETNQIILVTELRTLGHIKETPVLVR